MDQAREKAAAGYILLWLLGIPIPVLLLIFLLRGFTETVANLAVGVAGGRNFGTSF